MEKIDVEKLKELNENIVKLNDSINGFIEMKENESDNIVDKVVNHIADALKSK